MWWSHCTHGGAYSYKAPTLMPIAMLYSCFLRQFPVSIEDILGWLVVILRYMYLYFNPQHLFERNSSNCRLMKFFEATAMKFFETTVAGWNKNTYNIFVCLDRRDLYLRPNDLYFPLV